MDQNDQTQPLEKELKLKADDIELKEVSEDPANLVPMMPEFDLPREIDGYEIGELLGKGASGLVFKARNIKKDIPCAIKIFRKELIPDKDAIGRFQKEVELLKSLSHPNIVSALDFGTISSGSPYMVMELIEGESIADRLDSGIVFQPRTMASVMREVCRALTYTHGRSIIHRDLKPGNIIVDEENIAKVVDFGVAKAIDYTGETITQLGAFVGTPHYVSPEQCLGKPVDERSDIYSLGACMFEMLTGLKALDASTPVEAIAQLVSEDRTHVEKTLQSEAIPKDIRTIILKCMNRNPEERYQKIEELDHDLGAFLVSRPLTFAGLEKKRSSMKSVTIAALAALICLSVFGFMISSLIQSNKVTAPPVVPAPVVTSAPTTHSALTGGRIIIRNRRTGKVLFSDIAQSLKAALMHASEKGISLAEADLRDAHLIQARISNIDLSGADLTGAQLTQAKLTGVKFVGATLTKANFTQAKIEDCDFTKADLSNATLIQTKAPGVNFNGANMQKANLTQAVFDRADFRGANLDDANITQADFDDALTY